MKSFLNRLLMAVLLATLSLSPCPARANEDKAPAAANCRHSVLKELCFICDAALREKGRLWCKEHNRYEDRCWECHPDLRDTKRQFCDGHGLYEDECFFCNPELKARPQAGSQVPAAGPRLMCKEHNVFEDECGICHPDLACKIEPGRCLKIRFASPQAAAKAGIRTAVPEVGPISAGVESFAELQFNQNKLAHIVAPVNGIIQEVEVDLGSRVKKNAVVVKMFSADYQRAVSELLMRRQAVERERKLRSDGVSAQKDLEEAEAAYQSAAGALRQFNPTGFDPAALKRKPAEDAFLELRAPFAGEIVERNAVRGAFIEAGKPLVVISDCSTMWAILNIPEARLARVRVGQKVELTSETLPGRTFTGTLTWIAAQVDERTRLVKARADVSNPDGKLRARMFTSARIITGHSEKAVLLPPSAVQQMEGKPFVFVKLQDDLFEARPVLIGARHNGMLEIITGAQQNDQVVISGGFLVKSQMLISRLGAGCCPE